MAKISANAPLSISTVFSVISDAGLAGLLDILMSTPIALAAVIVLGSIFGSF